MCKDSEKFRQSRLELLAELTPSKTSPNLQPNCEKTGSLLIPTSAIPKAERENPKAYNRVTYLGKQKRRRIHIVSITRHAKCSLSVGG